MTEAGDRSSGTAPDPDEEPEEALPVAADDDEVVPIAVPLGVVCPSCDLDCEEGATFCAGCGAALVRTCRICDAEIPVDHRFCAGCGIPVEKLGQVEEHLRGGREALARGDYEASREELDATVTLLRDEPRAASLTRTIEHRRHRVEERLERRARTLARIRELRSESRVGEALEIAETAATTDPACPEYGSLASRLLSELRQDRLRLAREAEKSGRLAAALTHALEAYSIEGPGQDEVRPVIDRLRGRQGDLEEACRGIEELLKRSKLAEAMEACADVAVRVGISPKLRELRAWVQKRLAVLDRHLARGRAALEYDDWETAGREFRAARKVAPRDPRAVQGLRDVTALRHRERLGRGEAALALRRWEEAIAEFRAASELRPDDPEAAAAIERVHRVRRRRRRRRIALVAAAVLLLAAVVAAGPVAKMFIDRGSPEVGRVLYEALGPVMIRRREVEEALAQPHLEAARARIGEGDRVGAGEEFRAALRYLRRDPAVLGEAVASLEAEVEALPPDGDARALLDRLDGISGSIPEWDERLDPVRERVTRMRDVLVDRVRADLVGGLAPERTWFNVREAELRFPAGLVRELLLLSSRGTAPVSCERDGDFFTVTVPLAEPGLTRFEFLAAGAQAYRASLSVDVGLDEEAPRISVGPDPIRTNRRELDLPIPATDDSARWGVALAAAGAECRDTGAKFPAELRDGQWVARVALPDTGDRWSFRVWASDLAGNVGEAEVEVRLDEGLGAVALSTAVPARDGVAFSSRSHVTLVARVAERELRLDGATRFVVAGPRGGGGREVPVLEGELRSVEDGLEVRKEIDLAEGRNEVVLHLVDPAGNEGDSDPLAVVVDTRPPVIERPELAVPKGGVLRRIDAGVHLLAPRPPTLVIRVREDHPDAVTVNGEARELSDGGVLAVDLHPGECRTTVEVRDRAGQSASETFVFFFHPLPPGVRVRDGRLLDGAGVEMCFVPGGKVKVEGEGLDPATVTVGPFLIDRREARPAGAPGGPPRVSVSFAEAAAIAARSGKELPLEEEWLRAATLPWPEGEGPLEMRGGVAEWVRAFAPSVPVADRVPALRGGIEKSPSLVRQPWEMGIGNNLIGFRGVIRLGGR